MREGECISASVLRHQLTASLAKCTLIHNQLPHSMAPSRSSSSRGSSSRTATGTRQSRSQAANQGAGNARPAGGGAVSPNTRANARAEEQKRESRAALWAVLLTINLCHWYWAIVIRYDSFADLISHYELDINGHPSGASVACANMLWQVDADHGGERGRQLPQDNMRFMHEWGQVFEALMAQYRTELSRLQAGLRGAPADVVVIDAERDARPKRSKKASKKTKKDKRHSGKRRRDSSSSSSPSTHSSSVSGSPMSKTSSSSEIGVSTRRQDRSQKQEASNELAVGKLQKVYKLLNNGYALASYTMPAPSSIMCCFDGLLSSTAMLPVGGNTKMAYLFQKEGAAEAGNVGGFSPKKTKVWILTRFNLVIDTWTVAFCVNFTIHTKFKRWNVKEHDETMLLCTKPGQLPQASGVILQVINDFKKKVEYHVHYDPVSQEAASAMCERLLTQIAQYISDHRCTLTTAVLEVQKMFQIFETRGNIFSSVSGLAAGGAGPCRFWAAGSCSQGSRCRFSHVESNKGNGNASRNSSRQASQSRSPSASRKADAGRTPGAKKKARFGQP